MKLCNAMCKSFCRLPDDDGSSVLILAIPASGEGTIPADVANCCGDLIVAPKRLAKWFLGDIPFFPERLERGSISHAKLVDALIGVADQRNLGSPFAEKV